MPGDLLARVQAEIEARRDQLHPFVLEYQELSSIAGALGDETGSSASEPPAPAVKRAGAARAKPGPAKAAGAAAGSPRGVAQKAILAALEHGSHTVSELVVVTGMSGAGLRENLRRLLATGAVVRARRDGKAAYALARPSRG